VSTVLAGEHGDGKIQGWHRDRLAAVYVRQSSRQQVLDHGESTRLQYGLAERAVALGWLRKVGTKTVTRTLSPSQLERYRPCSTTPSAFAS
jgi:hypothetical protein